MKNGSQLMLFQAFSQFYFYHKFDTSFYIYPKRINISINTLNMKKIINPPKSLINI